MSFGRNSRWHNWSIKFYAFFLHIMSSNFIQYILCNGTGITYLRRSDVQIRKRMKVFFEKNIDIEWIYVKPLHNEWPMRFGLFDYFRNLFLSLVIEKKEKGKKGRNKGKSEMNLELERKSFFFLFNQNIGREVICIHWRVYVKLCNPAVNKIPNETKKRFADRMILRPIRGQVWHFIDEKGFIIVLFNIKKRIE